MAGRRSFRFSPILAASAIAIAGLSGALATAAHADVSSELSVRMAAATPGQRLPVLVTLTAQAKASRTERPTTVLRSLRVRAERTQRAVTRDLSGPLHRFWVVNAVAGRATPSQIRRLAARPAVREVELNAPEKLAQLASPSASDDAPNWAVAAVGAPTAWAAGATGTGELIGSIDTGVDPSTPSLAGKIAAWHDFVGGQPTPYDDDGHGTFTVGEMVGGSGGSDSGVAPGARVVVAKAFDGQGNASPSALLAAAQWMTDPDGNPATADYPTVINNSWASPDANETWFRPLVQNWLALGIVPVFAAGNFGPGPGSVASPASYPEVLAVGAVDSHGTVASFSGRGPVVWQNRDGNGPAAGTVLAKPDLVAPGVQVPGFVGQDTELGSGTSMAAPYVAGVVALMRQVNPALPVDQVEDILRQTAQDLGPAGPDPDSGYGLVNASAAIQAIGAPRTAAASPPVLAALSTRARVSRKAGPLVVNGRVVGIAQVHAVVQPMRGGKVSRVARVALTRVAGPVDGTFRLTLPVRGLAPGTYRLSVTPTTPGETAGSALTRQVRILP